MNRVVIHLFVASSALLVLPASVRAQAQATPAAPVNNFAKLIPNPTGQNGYEEFVRAGDILQSSPEWRAFENLPDGQTQTLIMKRQILSDPAVKAALDLVRTGISKPVKSPRASMDDETLLPELAAFRGVAHALGHQIYVHLADGRVAQAIDTLGVALKFGCVVQMDTLISGLVAIAVDAIAIRPVADHLDQLSVRDCEKLLTLAREWLLLPDPAIAILQSDRKAALAVFEKYKSDPAKLVAMLDIGNKSPDSKARNVELAQSLSANPNAATPVFDQAIQILAVQYDHAVASLSQPMWERKPFPPIDRSTPAGYLASEFGGGPVLLRVLDKYAKEQAQVQMLGVHAAIRRWQWEHNSLPPTLGELNVGRMIVDPFSGKPFDYKTVGAARYTLTSIGPLERDPAAGAAPNQRQPITFDPKP